MCCNVFALQFLRIIFFNGALFYISLYMVQMPENRLVMVLFCFVCNHLTMWLINAVFSHIIEYL